VRNGHIGPGAAKKTAGTSGDVQRRLWQEDEVDSEGDPDRSSESDRLRLEVRTESLIEDEGDDFGMGRHGLPALFKGRRPTFRLHGLIDDEEDDSVTPENG
jgi:hypothetical protein